MYECHTNCNSGNCNFPTLNGKLFPKRTQRFEMVRCSHIHTTSIYRTLFAKATRFFLLFLNSHSNQIHINKCIWGTVNTNKPRTAPVPFIESKRSMSSAVEMVLFAPYFECECVTQTYLHTCLKLPCVCVFVCGWHVR